MSLDEKNLQCNINNDCGNTALINSLPAARIKSSLLYSPSPSPSPYSSSPQITRMAIISFLRWQTGMHHDIW